MATLVQPQMPAMTPIRTTVRKVFDEVLISEEDGTFMGISVMAQHFTDRVWICVNEVASADDKMRPGTIIVGTPSPMGGVGMGEGCSSGAEGGNGMMVAPDELEVVMGDRDDPLTNVLSGHIFHLVAQLAPGKGMCLCLSTRKLTRGLKTPAVKKAAIDHIMGLVVGALTMA